MSNRSKITGIYAPNLVPLDESGNIAEDELRRYVDWLIEHGVQGLYPNGSTGEFTRFNVAERRKIVTIVVEQAAGRVPVVAGAAEANVCETLAACDAYGELGVKAVAIVAPFYYRHSPENVYAYYAEIARQTSVDITLYNIPIFASPIDLPTVRRLSEEFECIVGIKDSSGDLAHMLRMIDAVRPSRPDFSFLCGFETILMPSLLMGCDGGTHATASVLPELTRAVYDLTQSGEHDRALALQFKLIEVFDVMLNSADFPEGVRAALRLRGLNPGRSRQPMHEGHRADEAKLQELMEVILKEVGADRND